MGVAKIGLGLNVGHFLGSFSELAKLWQKIHLVYFQDRKCFLFVFFFFLVTENDNRGK